MLYITPLATHLTNISIFVRDMEKLSKIKVTKFKNLTAKQGSSIFMFEELRNIKNGTYKDLVTECRKALNDNDKALYVALKSKLPAVTFCGEFEGRKVSDLLVYNNIMVIDIDALPANNNIDSTKRILSKDQYILSIWKSPSGRGLKCLIRIDSDCEKHKLIFNSLQKYFLEKYNIEIDASGKDISRLCFTSWDEEIIYNSKSIIYKDLEEPQKSKSKVITTDSNIILLKNAHATEGLNLPRDRDTMRRIIKYLHKKGLSITDSYENWLKVSFSISYSFSYDVGEKYFLSLCRLDGVKHDEKKSLELLKSCYNRRQVKSSNTISFSTIAFLAKEKGFR